MYSLISCTNDKYDNQPHGIEIHVKKVNMLPTIVKAKLYVKIKEIKLNLQHNSDTKLFYVYYDNHISNNRQESKMFKLDALLCLSDQGIMYNIKFAVHLTAIHCHCNKNY